MAGDMTGADVLASSAWTPPKLCACPVHETLGPAAPRPRRSRPGSPSPGRTWPAPTRRTRPVADGAGPRARPRSRLAGGRMPPAARLRSQVPAPVRRCRLARRHRCARPRPARAHLPHRQDGARPQRGPLLCDAGGAALADHALDGLRGTLRDRTDGGWFTQVGGKAPVPDIKSCYDHAFVVLAASSASVAGRPGAAELLAEALTTLNDRFWDPDERMYADHWDRTWTTLSPYRGINPHMHADEALPAATGATGETRWRQRAQGIAERVIEFASDRQWRASPNTSTRHDAVARSQQGTTRRSLPAVRRDRRTRPGMVTPDAAPACRPR